MRGMASDSPAWCGDVLPSQVSVGAAWVSVVQGTLPLLAGSSDGSIMGT